MVRPGRTGPGAPSYFFGFLSSVCPGGSFLTGGVGVSFGAAGSFSGGLPPVPPPGVLAAPLPPPALPVPLPPVPPVSAAGVGTTLVGEVDAGVPVGSGVAVAVAAPVGLGLLVVAGGGLPCGALVGLGPGRVGANGVGVEASAGPDSGADALAVLAGAGTIVGGVMGGGAAPPVGTAVGVAAPPVGTAVGVPVSRRGSWSRAGRATPVLTKGRGAAVGCPCPAPGPVSARLFRASSSVCAAATSSNDSAANRVPRAPDE